MTTNAKPGRPRDPHADAAILAAARDLMAEGGLAKLTVEGTAQRAGVAKTTVYRRYATKLDLAVAAVAALVAQPPSYTSVEGVTQEGVNLFEEAFASRGAQASFLAVAAAAANNPEIHERFTREVLMPVRDQVAATIADARDKGQASATAPVEFAYDVMLGALIHRIVIRQLPPDAEFLAHFMQMTRYLYRGLPPCE